MLRSDPAGLSYINSLTNISYIHVQRPIIETDSSCEDKLQVKQHGNDEVFKR